MPVARKVRLACLMVAARANLCLCPTLTLSPFSFIGDDNLRRPQGYREERLVYPPQLTIDLWSLMLYGAVVILLIVAMMLISYVLGERHRGHATDEPYESGAPVLGSARLHLSAKFYLVAMFFVVFDVESVFILAWALAARQLAWLGYADILVFIGVLVVALVYLWRLGALDWGPRKK